MANFRLLRLLGNLWGCTGALFLLLAAIETTVHLPNVRKTDIFSDIVNVKTATEIRKHILALPKGEPFTCSTFLSYGARASVDQALSRLKKKGIIERLTRGVYVRPEINRFVGKVMPSPQEVVETIAKQTGAVVQIHGSEAARRLELTTQMSTQAVYITSGSSKHFRIGTLEVRLVHASSRRLALAGRPAGEALAALLYLGKNAVGPKEIAQVKRKLSTSEYEVLRQSAQAMPAWMSDALMGRKQNVLHG